MPVLPSLRLFVVRFLQTLVIIVAFRIDAIVDEMLLEDAVIGGGFPGNLLT